ncbi:MAG: peptidase S41, partial [Dysgonomonas sp.]
MRNRLIVLLALPLLLGTISVQAQNNPDKNKQQQRYFDINKNIEIFNAVVREMDMFYVDSVDINKTIRTGIDDMLQ